MPRGSSDYPDAFHGWNMVSSVGAYISVAGAFLFVGIVLYSLIWGKRVGANYLGEGATTLEWTVSSPPPFHQFEHLPRVKLRAVVERQEAGTGRAPPRQVPPG